MPPPPPRSVPRQAPMAPPSGRPAPPPVAMQGPPPAAATAYSQTYEEPGPYNQWAGVKRYTQPKEEVITVFNYLVRDDDKEQKPNNEAVPEAEAKKTEEPGSPGKTETDSGYGDSIKTP